MFPKRCRKTLISFWFCISGIRNSQVNQTSCKSSLQVSRKVKWVQLLSESYQLKFFLYNLSDSTPSTNILEHAFLEGTANSKHLLLVIFFFQFIWSNSKPLNFFDVVQSTVFSTDKTKCDSSNQTILSAFLIFFQWLTRILRRKPYFDLNTFKTTFGACI